MYSRKLKFIALVLALAMLTSSCSLLKKNTGEDIPVAVDAKISQADATWTKLMEGNAKFVKGTAISRTSKKSREKLAVEGQSPDVVIVTCSDARLSPEYIFGADLGELYVVRSTGNVVGDFEIGSVEYALEHLDVPLVVVLGHTACGAVQGAIEGSDIGYLGSIYDDIKPLVEEALKAEIQLEDQSAVDAEADRTKPSTSLAGAEPATDATTTPEVSPQEKLYAEVTRLNVYNTIDALYKSEIINSRVAAQKVKIIGALYDMPSGTVAPYNQDSYTLGNNILYKRAIEDAMVPEKTEILPLVSLVRNNANVRWNKEETKVLVGFWHDLPKNYIKGETLKVTGEDVWVFSQAEMELWYKANSNLPANRTLRFEQLMGLPQNSGYTHFTMAWVSPSDLLRPAYDSDVTTSNVVLEFPYNTSEAYKAWFDRTIISSYYDPPTYPWTRLGYTFDWADNGKEYGLSEFIVKQSAEIVIDNTLTTDQYIDTLKGNIW